MGKNSFAGFPEEGLKFLKALKRNNNREWFQPRKEIFETKVKAPMIELVEAINSDLVKVAPDYVSDPKKAIFRIYRDTRFSHDKTPYKTHLGAVFGRRGMGSVSGGMLYFHIASDEIEVAGGMYHPERDQLRQVREFLAEHHEEYRKLVSNRKVKALLGDVQGEEVSRMPKGFAADHPAGEILRKKDWIYDTKLQADAALKPGIAGEITARFRLMLPLVEFLNRALPPEAAQPDRDFF